MHFGENQLSRSLIGLSPLPTGHPPGFQPWWVRSSTRSYPRFTLPMGRSLRFGSRTRDSFALFGLAFATASPHGLTSPRIANSQAHSSKGTQSRLPKELRSHGLEAHGFRYYFTPLPGYFSPFPHGTCPLSVTREYLGLAGGPARFARDFTGPVLLGNTPTRPRRNVYGGSTLYAGPFKTLRLQHDFLTRRQSGRTDQKVPQPRPRNPCRVSHATGLA